MSAVGTRGRRPRRHRPDHPLAGGPDRGPLPGRGRGGGDDGGRWPPPATPRIPWAGSSPASAATCRPGWGSRFLKKWRPSWPRPCCRFRPPRDSRSAPGFAGTPVARLGPQRPLRSTRRPAGDRHQQQRRDSRRDHQRRADPFPGGLQAAGDHRAAPGDGRFRRPARGPGSQRVATTPVSCRGRFPSWRPWRLWSSPTWR